MRTWAVAFPVGVAIRTGRIGLRLLRLRVRILVLRRRLRTGTWRLEQKASVCRYVCCMQTEADTRRHRRTVLRCRKTSLPETHLLIRDPNSLAAASTEGLLQSSLAHHPLNTRAARNLPRGRAHLVGAAAAVGRQTGRESGMSHVKKARAWLG